MIASELRLGNFVNFMEDDTKFQVLEICPEGIRVRNDNEQTWIEIDQFNGIKLSKEILEKSGFTPSDLPNDPYGGYLSPYDEFMQKVRIRTAGGGFFYTPNESSAPIFIKSVHELQNLMYVLTGQELTINL